MVIRIYDIWHRINGKWVWLSCQSNNGNLEYFTDGKLEENNGDFYEPTLIKGESNE